MAITEFLSLEKPAKEDRINVDVLNDNTDEIDKHFERTSIVLSVTDNNISVDATGPYYTVTNNNADTVQALLEGNSMLLDPGETFKMNKDATETFTLTVSCASDVTVTYFQRNKDYVDGSLVSNLTNYYDKTDSDSIFLKTADFGNMRNEKSDSICTVDLPLKYNACGNPVEEYRIYGDTSQMATPTLTSAVIPIGTGDLVTDSESEHYNEYALPIINNSIAYNMYLATPLYRVNDKSDYIDYARQKVTRNVGIITYDGSTDEAWENYEYKNYRIDLTNLGGGDNPGVSYEVLCDKLLKTSEGNLGIIADRIAICDGKVCVHFDSALTTVSEFKAYLQSNPITVYYPLASEVTEDVTLPDIPTISGENQLYVNTTVTPKKVVVGALMQYLTRKDMNDTFPGLDEVNTAISNKADSTVLTAHTGNADIHVTAEDKTTWNNAVSPYTYLTQAEYEALETSDPDTLYWVTYPLSGDHVVWKNGEATDCRVEDIGFALDSTAYYKCPYSKFVLTKNVSGSAVGKFPYAKAVDVANSVTSLGNTCFSGCSSLAEISIPNSVTSLGDTCFNGCSSLTEISIPNSVTSLGAYCFNGCSSLAEISISNSITKLGGYCFNNCSSLTEISIPNSATSLGNYCFNGCSSLMSIGYNGTKSQFTAISKGTNWKTNVPTTCIVHCTGGDYPITDFA